MITSFFIFRMSALNILKKKRPNQNGIPLIHGKTEAEFIQDLKKFHSSRRYVKAFVGKLEELFLCEYL